MRELLLPGLTELGAMRYSIAGPKWSGIYGKHPVSLPVAAAMGAAAVIIKNPTITRRNMFFGRKRTMTLAQVRDILLPGLRMSDPEVLLDISVDFEYDNLLVRGFHKPSGRVESFTISRRSIENETYNVEFAPKLRKLVQELKGEEAPVPELPLDPVFGRKLDL